MRKSFVLKACLFIVGLCLITSFFNFLYVEHDEWSRIVWHNYYNEEDNIDNLYLGTSLVFCAIDPYALDEINGKNNFTMATNSQPLNGSYYILKEVDKKHNISRVCIGLSHSMMISGKGDYMDENSIHMNWRNTDFMEFSLNKLEYVLCMSASSNYVETLIPFTRYRDKLFNVRYVIENIERKLDKQYRAYEYFSENEYGEIVEYSDKGRFYSTEVLSDEELEQNTTEMDMNNFPITDISKKYLREIIEYCEKNDIEVVFFTVPMPTEKIKKIKNYDSFINQINEITGEYGVEYYNFNLCKEQYLPLSELQYFKDVNHFNSKGAALFTPLFEKVINNSLDTNNEVFYSSYEEKANSENYY